MTGKKVVGRESLKKFDWKWGTKRKPVLLTVGTTLVPNLAKRGRRAGKSIPLSQILTPPVVDPDSGFTSVSVGRGPPSIPREVG